MQFLGWVACVAAACFFFFTARSDDEFERSHGHTTDVNYRYFSRAPMFRALYRDRDAYARWHRIQMKIGGAFFLCVAMAWAVAAIWRWTSLGD